MGIVYRLSPQKNTMGIAKLAVPEQYRRFGFGRQLIAWSVQYAKALKDIHILSLCSLPKAVNFYRRLGFKKIREITEASEDDSLIPGQIHMELKTGRAAKLRCRR